MAIAYNSTFTGQHNDEYHNRISALENILSSSSSAGLFLRSDKAWTNALSNSLHIYGQTYGNTATDLLSGTAGVFRFGDPGPQITFDYSAVAGSGQAGALIFTDHDSAGTGVSWHFVTNQNTNDNGGDATVTAPRFRARAGLTVGQNTNNTNYALYVNGVTVSANVYGGSWIKGTKDANFRVTAATTASAGGFYQGWFSGKTPAGAWSLGCLSGNNDLYFVYGTDANYNANTNSTANARITTAGAFTNASKREYKENIKLVDYSSVDLINSIDICSFNMKSDPDKSLRIGFIADDTHEIFSGKQHDVMDLNNCVGMLLKAVQELSQEIQELKQELNKK